MDAQDLAYNDWSITALSPWPWPVLAAAVVLLAVAAWVVAGPLRTAPGATRRLLLGLRALGLLAGAALLVEPGLQLQQVSSTPGRVAVLLDTSRSMGLPSGGEAPATRMDRAREFVTVAAAALQRLPPSVSVESWTFDRALAPSTAEALRTVAPAGDRSDLWRALTGVLDGRPGKPLAGVLLISDGADTHDLPGNGLPLEAAERLRRAGVPVHTVALGAERGYRDVAVESVRADDFAFVRNPLEVEATLVATGYDALDLPVTLRRDGRVVAVTQVQLPGGGGRAVARFKFEPRDVGEAVYAVEVPAQVGEVIVDNNRRSFTLKTIRDRIRVLQVAGRPSWDVRFLRRLLKENPSVDLISFFILRTPSDNANVRQDELSLIPFPTRELFTEELGTFDVVVFQNFNFGPYEMGAYLPNVRQFVLNGGGFAMVGGELSFSEAGYDSTVLADVLPVRLPPGRGHYVEEPYTPTVTEAGRRHPIMALPGGRVGDVVGRLPQFEGFNLTDGLAPGAEALLTHPAPRSGPRDQPVLAVREVGKGRTLSLMTDNLWFWALPDAGADGRGTAHRELWANAIRWLIGDPALSRVRVEARGGAFDPGQPVELVVRAFDASYRPLPGAHAELVLEGALEGGDAAVPYRAVAQQKGVTGPEGEWVVRVPSPGPGAYRARVTARAAAGSLGSDEDAFLVRQSDREIAEGAPRPELMAALSEASGGTVVRSPDDVGGLEWKIPEGVRVHRRRTEPLWDRWEAGAVFALLWALEWVLRRRAGFA
ncbi:MAG: hypothetical protein HY904_01225 [Deltaproteobacteria bacterium]|nr:hypothetical protein [Deltaproteobacteria bacterium]